MTKLTKRLRELEAKATAGPWEKVSSLPVYAVAATGRDVVTATGREYRQVHSGRHGSREDDAALIAHTRNTLTTLLDIIDCQREALAYYADWLNHHHDGIGHLLIHRPAGCNPPTTILSPDNGKQAKQALDRIDEMEKKALEGMK